MKIVSLKRSIFVFLSCWAVAMDAQAQKIPFSYQFANAIRYVCPACLNDFNELTAVGDTLTYLNLKEKGIQNLEGIQNFRSLKYLNCANNQLTNLPTVLPESLETLYCFGNQLTALPALPASLKNLYTNDNQLVSLPALPDNLERLDCSSNQIKELPNLPARLQELDFDDNPVLADKLPLLPDSLTSLRCPISAHNRLQNKYPHLLKPQNNPKHILLDEALAADIRVRCNSCVSKDNYLIKSEISGKEPLVLTNPQIRNLSALRLLDIENLYIEIPNLYELDVLPRNLKRLTCVNMQLTKLPTLPRTLTYLNCSNNQLTEFPALPPNLTHLNCAENKMEKLPNLPKDIESLICSNNKLEVFLNISLYPELRHLDMQHNKLKKIKFIYAADVFLQPSYHLEYVNVAHNEIEDVELQNFGRWDNFNCAYNKIKTVNIRSTPYATAHIETFDCSHNQIETLYWSLSIYSKVDTIDCSHNNISSLDISAEWVLKLNCAYNNLHNIPNRVVKLVKKQLIYDNNPIPEKRKQEIDTKWGVVSYKYERQRLRQARRDSRGGGGGGLNLMDFLWLGGK